MLTSLHVEGFKGLNDVTVPLRNPTVLTGEFEGKTSLLQALMLWQTGLSRWVTSSGGRSSGAVLNPLEVTAVPHRVVKNLWPDRKAGTPIRVTVEGGVEVQGVWEPTSPDEPQEDVAWSCGFEFRYLNDASLSAKPVNPAAMPPGCMLPTQFVMSGPVTGLAIHEPRLERGAVNVRLGEGRTSEVLRNLCLLVSEGPDGPATWEETRRQIERIHHVLLDKPEYIPGTGNIDVYCQDSDGHSHELIASCRGLQQSLALLCLMHLAKGGVVLLDSPDAGMPLASIRQHINLYRDAQASYGTQIITVAHSDPMMLWASSDGVLVAHRESDLPQKLLDEGLGETARYISK